jgi:hypothetical protein
MEMDTRKELVVVIECTYKLQHFSLNLKNLPPLAKIAAFRARPYRKKNII